MTNEHRIAKMNEHERGPCAALLKKKGKKALMLHAIVRDPALSVAGLSTGKRGK